MRVALIGVGLVGGSIALALRRADPRVHLTGYDVLASAQSAIAASALVDCEAVSLETAVERAELIVIATPLIALAEIFAAIAPVSLPDAILIDVASTKGSALASAKHHLGALYPRYVPCHPIAGSERSGAAFARADLFDGKPVVMTPDERTDVAAIASVRALWQTLGARVAVMSALYHDELFAYLSHLPHLLAFAYMAEAGDSGIPAADLDAAGPGFRDFTRIAAAQPELWADILLDNRQPVLALLERHMDRLNGLRQALSTGERETLCQSFSQAQRLRLSLS